MFRRPWTPNSRKGLRVEKGGVLSLVLVLLTVSWLPLSVRAWSGAWSAWHPVSGGLLVQLMTQRATRQGQTFWSTHLMWAD